MNRSGILFAVCVAAACASTLSDESSLEGRYGVDGKAGVKTTESDPRSGTSSTCHKVGDGSASICVVSSTWSGSSAGAGGGVLDVITQAVGEPLHYGSISGSSAYPRASLPGDLVACMEAGTKHQNNAGHCVNGLHKGNEQWAKWSAYVVQQCIDTCESGRCCDTRGTSDSYCSEKDGSPNAANAAYAPLACVSAERCTLDLWCDGDLDGQRDHKWTTDECAPSGLTGTLAEQYAGAATWANANITERPLAGGNWTSSHQCIWKADMEQDPNMDCDDLVPYQGNCVTDPVACDGC